MRRGANNQSERGQSEVIGIVLLLAVVVTLVLGAGAVIIADWQSQTDQETLVNVQSNLTATELTLQHMGGESLPPKDVLVVLDGANRELRLDDSGFNGTPARFKAGSSWEYSSFSPPLTGEVTLQVFDTAENTLLHQKRYDV
ncbi:type IV pilin [Halovenus rubra]|uniref:Type IV pilin n=2 Tax=Halovenus rubra TaxID=869890 RepID=A0ABD5X9V8_9EURY|nr:type IV pilin [Halovenus rubra]